ncbi:hypothetical protein SAY87_019100 [Trapa incisa]|uniref:BHLH domain-containing protein n=1 Tax=Trapa incisa TaxID=236973 RepID=A0AAN7K3Y3_9MYRT|nr:hypothetical protein SAY87_019100 [Trapa incisa]
MDSGYQEYHNSYWEANMFEFDSYSWVDKAISGGYYDSSSPDGAASFGSAASKNIVSERNRRKKINEKLFALRSVVPNISKMDKASIIKDAIDYIQKLHEEVKMIEAEIAELESGGAGGTTRMVGGGGGCNSTIMNSHSSSSGGEVFYGVDFDQADLQLPPYLGSKKKRTREPGGGGGGDYVSGQGSRVTPIDDLELRVTYMGDRTVVVSLTCSRRTDTIVKLCQVFESLKLKIITANIAAFSGRLSKTIFVEVSAWTQSIFTSISISTTTTTPTNNIRK